MYRGSFEEVPKTKAATGGSRKQDRFVVLQAVQMDPNALIKRPAGKAIAGKRIVQPGVPVDKKKRLASTYTQVAEFDAAFASAVAKGSQPPSKAASGGSQYESKQQPE